MTVAPALKASPLARLSRLAVSRAGWALLALVAAAALSVGSIHSGTPSARQRASYLDSVIKCPSCEDLSIAQSDAGVALALRAEVRRLVGRGWSDQRIEQAVVAQYGPGEILTPSSELAWIIPLAVGGVAAIGVSYGLARARRRRRTRATDEEERLVQAAMRDLEDSPWAT
jgi:cytochrome c-type biogenesis protein CcmH